MQMNVNVERLRARITVVLTACATVCRFHPCSPNRCARGARAAARRACLDTLP